MRPAPCWWQKYQTKISGHYYTDFDPESPIDLIHTLKKHHVSILVCGAISKTPASLILDQHIHLISFVTGNARQFLDSFALARTVEKRTGCRDSSNPV